MGEGGAQAEPTHKLHDGGKPLIGYIGRPKGLRQTTWEIGLEKDDISARATTGKNLTTVLSDHPDLEVG